MKMKSILLSMLAVAAFCSCSKDDVEGNLPDGERYVTMSLDLGKLGASKSVGNVASETAVKIGDVITLDEYSSSSVSGDGVRTTTMNYTEDFTTGGASPSAKDKTLTLPSLITYLKVIANGDGNVHPDGGTLGDNVNTRQGGTAKAVVRTLGSAEIKAPAADAAANASFTCDILLSPEMARIEITGALPAVTVGTDKITDLKINAIYINNTYLLRDETILNSTTGAANLVDWDKAFGDTDLVTNAKWKLWDDFATAPSTSIAMGAGFADDGACGYNIYPQALTDEEALVIDHVKAKHPHIIFKVEYKVAGSADATVTKYLNITRLKVTKEGDPNNGKYTSIAAGNVYTFTLEQIWNILNVQNPPTTDLPDEETRSVEVAVTVASWVIVSVSPEV